MVSVKVYGDPIATCTQRILILLEELSLKYDFALVDLMKGDQKNEEFLKLQPFGKVPVLEYDNRVLFESRSVLRYVSKNNQEIQDLLGDVDVDIWLEVESQNFNPPASKIVYEKVFKKWHGQEPDEQIIEKYLKELETVLDVYEHRLSTNAFIGGESFSIADISHIPYANHLIKAGYKSIFKSRPNVYKWIKKIIKRDSVDYVMSLVKSVDV
jgi:glutathione S-transferase